MGKTADKAVLGLLKSKGDIARAGSTLPQMRHELKGKFRREAIESSLVRLAAKGRITVDRTGDVITGVHYIDGRDRTDRSPQYRREQMWAKGISPYLRDDQCSPVVISHVRDRLPKESVIEVKVAEESGLEAETCEPTPPDTPPLTRLEWINLAYLAIREAITQSEGRVFEGSLVAVIVEALEIPEHRARSFNNDLGRIGLRITKNCGGGRFTHTLPVEIEEITEGMYWNGIGDVSETTPDQDDVVPVETPPEAVAPIVAADAFERLVSIITDLEARNAELSVSLTDKAAETASLLAQLTERDAHIANLESQLLTRGELPVSVSDILTRYPSS